MAAAFCWHDEAVVQKPLQPAQWLTLKSQHTSPLLQSKPPLQRELLQVCGGAGGVQPYHGDDVTGLLQHSWPRSVGQSLSVMQVLSHDVEHSPSQHSCPAPVLQSCDVTHVLGQLCAASHRPATLGDSAVEYCLRYALSAIAEQHVWPLVVSHCDDVLHCLGHDETAVQNGCA